MADARFEILCANSGTSAPETIREVEEYQVELSDLTVLELIIVPDIGGGTACASLQSLRLA